MSKPSAKILFPHPSAKLLVSVIAGVLMGQVVLAIAAEQDHSITGLGFALVFVLAGSMSVALFLKHFDVEQRSRSKAAPIQTWLMATGIGALVSIYANGIG